MHYDADDEHSKKKCLTLLHDELQILDKVLEIFDKLLTALGKRKCLVGKEIEILFELVLVRALVVIKIEFQNVLCCFYFLNYYY